jgi:hypothetical protein
MSETTFYSSGGPWGVGDGSVPVDNATINQTLDLTGTGTNIKVWFAGNGSSSYWVQSSVVTQGALTKVVKVNGATTFQIPAYGRWSDYLSISGFTLPGTATFTSVVKLSIPMLIPILYDPGTGVATPQDTGSPGVVAALIHSDDSKLELDFEGVDGATTWTETAQGLSPVRNFGCEIDTAHKYSGSSSLKLLKTADAGNEGAFSYTIPDIADDFEFIFRFRYDAHGAGIYIFLTDGTAPEETLVGPYISVVIEGLTTMHLTVSASDKNDTVIGSYEEHYIHSGNWNTVKISVAGREVTVEYNGLKAKWMTVVDTPFAGLDTLTVLNYSAIAVA